MAPDVAREHIPGFELAGAVVRRPFNRAGARVPVGAVLSAEDYMAINYPVRRVFANSGQITPFYRRPGDADYTPSEPPAARIAVAPAAPGVRHIIHRGGGRYDVVSGSILNDQPLSRETAEALAKQKDQ
jgi:hypothetical protein